MSRQSVARRINIILSIILLALILPKAYQAYRNWKSSPTRVALWGELQPIKLQNCDLRRYGTPYDGGYLLCGNLLSRVEASYSYGIGAQDPWSCDVSKGHDLLVHQYDCFDPTRPACDGGRFTFHDECIGPQSEDIEGRRFDSLDRQIKKNGDAGKKLLIKMDVEGAETRSLLAASDATLADVDQLVIEFHDVNEKASLDVIKKLKRRFFVVDVHFNNYSCRTGISPFPASAYEVLFVNKDIGIPEVGGKRAVFPNPFWRANNSALPDCQREILPIEQGGNSRKEQKLTDRDRP